MNKKDEILSALRAEFALWEELLDRMTEAEITAHRFPLNWSIKDVIVHLWAWQQRSIARVKAALDNREPDFPRWAPGLDPEADEDVEQLNAWIYEMNRERPWSAVHRDWREGFQRFVELGRAVREDEMLEVGRYPWLKAHPLSYILTASLEHHQEHREILLDSLDQNNA